MTVASNKTERLIPALIFISAVIVFSAAYRYLRNSGAVQIDDAFITFRYAENIARGLGFVYNQGERVLGTSTPIFCLLLALLRRLGARIPLAADIINLVCAGLCASLIYLIGREAKSRALGLLAVFLFVLFPHFWINLTTGMETMFTAFLCLSVVWLDLRKRPVAAGIAAGVLVLTRLDAAALVAAVFLVRLFRSPRNALLLAGSGLATLLPWLIFSTWYFGSPVPQSLLTKKLIHILSPRLIWRGYWEWFLGIQEIEGRMRFSYPPMVAYLAFAAMGAIRALQKERWARVFFLWVCFFLAGMIMGRAGSFFWYKIPMLTGYLILVAVGIEWIGGLVGKRRGLAMALQFVTAAVLAGALFWKHSSDDVWSLKEKANRKLAQAVRERKTRGAKIFAGEIGVIGYELREFYIIDSAGLVSREVYKIRLEDKKALMKISPRYRWDWWGSPDWVKKVIAKYRPDFIVSELRYLHLRTLLDEPDFRSQYRVVALEPAGKSVIVLLEKNEGGPGK